MTRTAIQFLAVVALATAVHAADFHVAPNGNDAWSGRLAEPNAAKTDGPLAGVPAPSS